MQADQQDVQIPIPELLTALLEVGGSDLHLTAGTPPTVRVHGELERLEKYPELTPRALQGMIYAILPQKLRESSSRSSSWTCPTPCPARRGSV